MPDVSKFALGGETVDVKDQVARTQSQSAVQQASEALQIAREIEQLSRVTVSYEQAAETITITTANHEGA